MGLFDKIKKIFERKEPQQNIVEPILFEEGSITGSVAVPNVKYKVLVRELNIRKGPGECYEIAGTIKNCGVYTIIEKKDSWGRLISGVGWIPLECCEKV